MFFFSFQSYSHHRDLHSFPTRRSSDLIARAAARRSLDRLAGESFCGNAGRRRYRACALVVLGGLSADRGKRVRLVACWPTGLLPVGASASRFPHATVLVPHEVSPAPGAIARFPCAIAHSRGEYCATAAEGRRSSALIFR